MMRILAISGSVRKNSTNTALLRALKANAPVHIHVEILENLRELPIFSQDFEGQKTPQAVIDFAKKVDAADGIVFSCPEYVHAIPGGLKNAIDWLVSRPEIIGKPIALMHASYGGDDLLYSLRKVLDTVSENFNAEIFAQFNLRSMSLQDIQDFFDDPKNAENLRDYLTEFETHILDIQEQLA